MHKTAVTHKLVIQIILYGLIGIIFSVTTITIKGYGYAWLLSVLASFVIYGYSFIFSFYFCYTCCYCYYVISYTFYLFSYFQSYILLA